MNRTKIEWTDFTWNPIVGCDHGCWYCYARKMCLRFPKIFPNGFKPTFHPERLQEPWLYKKPSKIFCCSISDIYAPWTLPSWTEAVLKSIEECPVDHTFQLLTKNPDRIPFYDVGELFLEKKCWIGTTVTCENGDWINLEEIKKIQARVKFASFEPLLGALPANVSLKGLDWIIIGKLTGSRRVKLDPEWVQSIMERAGNTPLFIKNNIAKDHPEFDGIQEFPT